MTVKKGIERDKTNPASFTKQTKWGTYSFSEDIERLNRISYMLRFELKYLVLRKAEDLIDPVKDGISREFFHYLDRMDTDALLEILKEKYPDLFAEFYNENLVEEMARIAKEYYISHLPDSIGRVIQGLGEDAVRFSFEQLGLTPTFTNYRGKPKRGRRKDSGWFKSIADFRTALIEILPTFSEKPTQLEVLKLLDKHPLCKRKPTEPRTQSRTSLLRKWIQDAGIQDYDEALYLYWETAK